MVQQEVTRSDLGGSEYNSTWGENIRRYLVVYSGCSAAAQKSRATIDGDKHKYRMASSTVTTTNFLGVSLHFPFILESYYGKKLWLRLF